MSNIIKDSIDKIEVSEESKKRMYANILSEAKKKNTGFRVAVIRYALPIAACLCLIVFITFKAINAGNNKGIQSEDNAFLGQPGFEYVDSAADFSKINISIEAPVGAEGRSYAIIDNKTANIDFYFDNNMYSYMASHEEIKSGYDSQGEEVVKELATSVKIKITSYTDSVNNKVLRAEWVINGIYYELVNADGSTYDKFENVVKMLSE